MLNLSTPTDNSSMSKDSVVVAPNHIRHRRWMETLLNENVDTTTTTGGSGTATQDPVPLSSTASSSSTASLTALGSLIVVALFIILGLSIWYVTWCTMRYYRQRKLRHDIMLLQRTNAHHPDGINDNGSGGQHHNGMTIGENHQPWYVTNESIAGLERIQRRYETIEHWAVTKRAQEHTRCCSTIQGQRSTSMTSLATTPSPPLPVVASDIETQYYDETNEIERECPICMGELAVGQILSWSSNPQCRHVYHHECIKEWLLRHKECCMCKQVYLPIDAKKKPPLPTLLDKTNHTTIPNYINELSQQFRAAVATSYYCIDHGLVRIPELFYCTQSELEQLEHHIIDGTIAPIDLISLRGSHPSLMDDSTTGISNHTVYNHNNRSNTTTAAADDDDPSIATSAASTITTTTNLATTMHNNTTPQNDDSAITITTATVSRTENELIIPEFDSIDEEDITSSLDTTTIPNSLDTNNNNDTKRSGSG